ncbi:hypothetical protein Bind_3179 [Beijerinckia indica subsp. indica ATCC 9039]|uniref:Uncharacterized protein n=1 Tax=Beijerinckia indica subsp. indica (strain ATCC 9039 / DSM 1715 / NCIMB 8712) TaxID=395963 RepID=B2ICE2_BEII9|nr:hypothetical protein Bind_3179 [Beijerinckia indica subsp. indica ATCC 9039]
MDWRRQIRSFSPRVALEAYHRPAFQPAYKQWPTDGEKIHAAGYSVERHGDCDVIRPQWPGNRLRIGRPRALPVVGKYDG